MVHGGNDLQLVERAPHEGDLRPQPGQVDVAGRRQPDRGERARQVISGVARRKLARRLHVGGRPLARFAEPEDGVTQLLQPGEPERRRIDGHQQAVDALVVAGAMDRFEVITQDEPLAAEDVAERFIAEPLRDVPADVHLDDAATRRLSGAPRHEADHHQADDDDADNDQSPSG